MVSEPDKHGNGVLESSWRTQTADSGSAFRYAALSGFADVHGVAVGTDYVAERSARQDPEDNGWATHAIMPPQQALSLGALLGSNEPRYVGRFSSDLSTGIFDAWSPLTDVPAVQAAPNLYLRNDLLSPGIGSYDLITGCPLCDATNTALPPFSDQPANLTRLERPTLAGTSPDFQHVAFESRERLTADAPIQPPTCDFTSIFGIRFCRPYLYEWDGGIVRLAGILPDGSAADVSVGGQGAGSTHAPGLTPDVVSDATDGHVRVFFTQPTDASGNTTSQGSPAIVLSASGNVFMRLDNATTQQLNVSEATTADAFAPATFLDASSDGTRAFFMTAQALTDDAPVGGTQKIYMYDATRPASDPRHLTLVNDGADPGDADAVGVVATSRDGRYFYFQAAGGIYLWHDGTVTRVGPPLPGARVGEATGAGGGNWTLVQNEARATPDGRHLLFPAYSGTELTGYDQGNCNGIGCRELYLFSADTGAVVCASCNPTGAPATADATVDFGTNLIGGTGVDPVNNRAITDDGSKVFFSTPEALVPEDTNGRMDAYEFDATTGAVSLLSSGASAQDSFFLNATPNGGDAFILTREQLVGWDTDSAYDVYDARVRGGFPEPPVTVACDGSDSCRGLPAPSIGAYVPQGSSVFAGAGNVKPVRARRAGPAPRKKCRRVVIKRKGRRRSVKRCVTAKARKKRAHARGGAQRRHS